MKKALKVLGVSGSPIKNSNTDRGVQAVLEATGCNTEFIKLIDYKLEPCRACGGCFRTNVCVIKDDGIALIEKVKEADAIIIGGFTPYSTMDARTKTFIERLYSLRHNHGYLVGKPGAAVITSCVVEPNESMPPAAECGAQAVQFAMMEEGMEYLGAVKIKGNVPCVKCGKSETCKVSGVKMVYGPEATAESVGIEIFEDQNRALKEAHTLGKLLAEKLNEN